MPKPTILILALPHGASHQRLARALQKALDHLRPGITVETVDALEHSKPWFRFYYNSYQIPLRYWPALWGWIESIQHSSRSTAPAWLYRRGGAPLFRYIQDFEPDIVIATEVGLCELAALLKRETRAQFQLIAVPPEPEIDLAWAQPEVDLYLLALPEMAARLEAGGVRAERIISCGLPVDPAFASLPDRAAARARLGISSNSPMLLVLFGGKGAGIGSRVVAMLEDLPPTIEVVLIAGMNEGLEGELRRRFAGRPRCRILGWVENIHEWMAAADLLISKPGAATVFEAINSGLPLLAVNPLPGEEQRTCKLIEDWRVGYSVKRPEELVATVARLLDTPLELERLRQNTRMLARPRAAYAAAEAILKLLTPL